MDVVGGWTVHLTATGLWDHTPYVGTVGPNGEVEGDSEHVLAPTADSYRQFGVSALTGPGDAAPLDLLVGVFLTDAPPSATGPVPLGYGTDGMTHPELQQLFAIGAGPIDVYVPAGATRLFFGLNDGCGWYDNSGEVTVTAIGVPEPSAIIVWSVLGASGVGIGWWRTRKRAG